MTEPSYRCRPRSLLVMRIWRWIPRSPEAPLLGGIYKSNPYQESFGRYRCFCKSHSIEHFTSSRNFGKEDSKCPMEVTRFGGRGKYTEGHIQLWLKVGPIASLAQFHVVKMKVSYHVLLGRPWLHKHRLVSSTYHQCVKGRLNGRMIRIAANPLPFEQPKAHLVETMFFDQWASSRESSVPKPRGTFMPKWEDVQGDLEPDLRELLARKKKRKEAPAQNQMTHPNMSRSEALMA